MTALCAPCSQQWLRWLDYRPPRRWLGEARALVNPIARRLTVSAILNDHHRFIRQQQAGIVAACQRTHQNEVAA